MHTTTSSILQHNFLPTHQAFSFNFASLYQTMGVLPFCEVAHLFQEVHKPFGFVRGGSLAIWRAPGVPQMLQGLSTAALRTSKWLPKVLRSTSREFKPEFNRENDTGIQHISKQTSFCNCMRCSTHLFSQHINFTLNLKDWSY